MTFETWLESRDDGFLSGRQSEKSRISIAMVCSDWLEENGQPVAAAAMRLVRYGNYRSERNHVHIRIFTDQKGGVVMSWEPTHVPAAASIASVMFIGQLDGNMIGWFKVSVGNEDRYEVDKGYNVKNSNARNRIPIQESEIPTDILNEIATEVNRAAAHLLQGFGHGNSTKNFSGNKVKTRFLGVYTSAEGRRFNAYTPIGNAMSAYVRLEPLDGGKAQFVYDAGGGFKRAVENRYNDPEGGGE